MESVGEYLRREREAQSKTIDDVAKATKINGQILKDLEGDRFSALPAAVYVKGHLKTYARYLGLDEEEIVQKYLRFTHQQEPDELDEWDAVELELHEQKQAAGRRLAWIGAAAAIVVVLVVLVVLLGDRGTEPESMREQPAVVEEPQQAAESDSMIEWHKLELRTVARHRTWIKVSIDGTPVADFTLNAGEERLWEADEYFELDVGSGGGLELYLDGEFLGTAGTGRRLVEGLVVDENGMSN